MRQLSTLVLLGLTSLLPACSTDPSEPGPPSLATSTITSSVTALIADGQNSGVITVTLRDAYGNAVAHSAGTVTMYATLGVLGPVTDHQNGTYSSTIRAPLAQGGVTTVTASLDGQALAKALVLPVDARLINASWYPGRTWLYADGISSTPVRIDIKDQNDVPVALPTDAVTMTATKGTLSAVSGGAGHYSANLTSTTNDEIAVVSVSVNGTPFGPALSVHFDHRHWVEKAPMPLARRSFGTATAGSVIYAVGGSSVWGNAVNWLDRVDSYDPMTNLWTTRAAMPTARTDLGLASAGGMLFAIGGYNDTDQSVVEAYDPASNTWSARAPMPTARGGLGVGVANGIIYAIGGRLRSSPGPEDLPGSDPVNVVEAYNPLTDAWTSVAPLPTARAHVGVGVIDGVVYAVGGQTSPIGESASLQAFHPETNQWSTLSPMPYPVAAPSVVVFQGKLYVIGGYEVYSGTDAVLQYDPATNTWTISLPPMFTARFALGAAEVNGLFYAIGGALGFGGPIANVEEFNP